MSLSQHPDMTWWRDARFGMFIHWGLYAIPALIHEDSRQPIRGNTHWLCITSAIGTVLFDEPGLQTLTLQVNKLNLGQGGGFVLRNLKLTPV